MPLLLSLGYLIKKSLIEYRMEYEMEQGGLQKLILPCHEVQWIKKDKEILVAGKFFDIKSYKIINNHLEATGVFDEKDNELHAGFTRLMRHKKDQSSPFHSIFLKFIFTATIPEYPATLLPPVLYISATINDLTNQRILNRYSSVITPPPKG